MNHAHSISFKIPVGSLSGSEDLSRKGFRERKWVDFVDWGSIRLGLYSRLRVPEK